MRRRIFAAVAVLSLVVTACGGDDDDDAGSGGSQTTDTTAAEAEVGPDRTAILTFGGYGPTSLDPIKPAYSCEVSTLNMIFDTLFAFAPNGEITPRLAEGFEVDGDILRIKLRDGLVFQDGTPLDADAVKFNLDRAMNDDESLIKNTLATVSAVTVVDPTTIELTMSTPSAGTILSALSDRAGMMASPAAVQAAGSSDAFSLSPVGSGMYKIEGDWAPRERVSVRAWDGYWDKDAQLLGGIDLIELSGEAQLNAIRAGDVDLSVMDDASAADTLSDFNVDIRPSNQYGLFILNETKPPLDDVRVRQAIAHAIDREAIASAVTFGNAEGAYQFFPPSSPIYQEELDDLFPYDVDAAKKLLADAGVADGFTLEAAVGNASPLYIQIGELIAGQLKEVGIEMNLALIDQAQANNDIVRQGLYMAAPYGGQTLADTYKQFNDYFMPGGINNAGNNEAEGLAPILEKAGASTDTAERVALFKEASELVTEGVYAGVPLYFQPSVTVAKKYVGGVRNGQLRCLFDFRGVYITEGQVDAPVED